MIAAPVEVPAGAINSSDAAGFSDISQLSSRPWWCGHFRNGLLTSLINGL
jgi:hypothetical protein